MFNMVSGLFIFQIIRWTMEKLQHQLTHVSKMLLTISLRKLEQILLNRYNACWVPAPNLERQPYQKESTNFLTFDLMHPGGGCMMLGGGLVRFDYGRVEGTLGYITLHYLKLS